MGGSSSAPRHIQSTTATGLLNGNLVSPNPVRYSGSTNRSAEFHSKTQQREPPKKKARVKPSKAFCVIWVCTHGKGQSRNWRKKDLKIMGVYPSKTAAEEAKRDIMSQYECCGHGDILVGGCWDDEIDLVIREAPLHLGL